MKILVANPNTSSGVTDRLVAAGKLVASPGTELVPTTAPRGASDFVSRASVASGRFNWLAKRSAAWPSAWW